MSEPTAQRVWGWCRWLAIGVLLGAFGGACDRRPEVRSPAPGEVLSGPSETPPFEAMAWNLNAGVEGTPTADRDTAFAALRVVDDIDVYGLSEVPPEWFDGLLEVARDDNDAPFDGRLSETGRRQRLAVLWNTDVFELVEYQELGRVNVDGYGRSPLAALLRHRATGAEILFVVVHLRRGNGEIRTEEARRLAALIEELGHATVLFGDMNLDCPADVDSTLGCNDAYPELVRDDVLRWVPHPSRVSTQCHTQRYNSILDFYFLGGAARRWDVVTSVPDRDLFCPWAMGPGSHRPVLANFGGR